MTSNIKQNKSVEMTINLKKLARRASWKYKAPKSIKYIKSLVSKQFRSTDDVLIAPDVNKFIWSNGRTNLPCKVRVKVERTPSPTNPEKSIFKISRVVVNTYKGLNSQSYVE